MGLRGMQAIPIRLESTNFCRPEGLGNSPVRYLKIERPTHPLPIGVDKKPFMPAPRVLIITPALANANNGNWQTAWRWSRMLRASFEVTIGQQWDGTPFDAVLALHARRSAASVAAWAKARGVTNDARGLAVVLTGTDLYRDIETDITAQASLELASRIVVLQERGPDRLADHLQSKTRVIFQSTTSRQSLPKAQRHLRAVMVGHLRDEKSPETLFAAAKLLRHRTDIKIDHIGEALDSALGRQARETAASCPNYRWLGGLAHEATRQHIQRAHVLIHTSKMEGGAHVILEAVRSGIPVLASHIAGNVGMLGQKYAGYFDHGDAQRLADLLLRCRKTDPLYDRLLAQCETRAPLFAPEREQAALIKLIHELLK